MIATNSAGDPIVKSVQGFLLAIKQGDRDLLVTRLQDEQRINWRHETISASHAISVSTKVVDRWHLGQFAFDRRALVHQHWHRLPDGSDRF